MYIATRNSAFNLKSDDHASCTVGVRVQELGIRESMKSGEGWTVE